MSTTAPRVKAATTDEELRVQAYRLIVSYDHHLGDSLPKRDGRHWSAVEKKVIQKLKDRGTPENLGIAETVKSVLKTYRNKEAGK